MRAREGGRHRVGVSGKGAQGEGLGGRGHRVGGSGRGAQGEGLGGRGHRVGGSEREGAQGGRVCGKRGEQGVWDNEHDSLAPYDIAYVWPTYLPTCLCDFLCVRAPLVLPCAGGLCHGYAGSGGAAAKLAAEGGGAQGCLPGCRSTRAVRQDGTAGAPGR